MISASVLAKIGVEHDVPLISWTSPPLMVLTNRACAETSGKPRPETLNSPAFVEPSFSR